MRSRYVASTYAMSGALFAALVGLVGCGSDDGGAPAPTDTGSQSDSGGEVDTSPVPDTQPEATPDTTDSAEAPDPLDGLTAAEWTILKTLGPLPAVPKDPTNKYADDAKAAALGQMLFFDKSYSGALAVGDDGTNGGLGVVGATGKVACASCHGGTTMDDNRSKPGNVSLGIDYGTRNTLSLVNSSFYAWTNWAGRFDSQWSLPPAVAENPKNMASTRLAIAHMLFNKYRTEYDAIFPDKLPAELVDTSTYPATGKPGDALYDALSGTQKDTITRIWANYGKALAAYVRLLVSRNTPFDKYVAGDFTAISGKAKNGMRLFIGTKAACISCHSGPNLADDKFHALGVPQTGPKVPATDLGRFTDVAALLTYVLKSDGTYSDDTTTGKLTGLVQVDSMKGQFRTKSLRGVGGSGPYMHAGQMATIADVVSYYDKGGDLGGDAGVVPKDPLIKPLGLTSTEAEELAAFLDTLVGEPVPSALTKDTSK